jgi:hypothetical protein
VKIPYDFFSKFISIFAIFQPITNVRGDYGTPCIPPGGGDGFDAVPD